MRFIYTSKNVNLVIIEGEISMIKYSLAERKSSLKLSDLSQPLERGNKRESA